MKSLLSATLAVSMGLTAFAGRSFYQYEMSAGETFELALDNVTNTFYYVNGGDRGHQFVAGENCTVKFLPGENPGGTAKIYLSFLPVNGELTLDLTALSAYDDVQLIGSVRADGVARGEAAADSRQLGWIKIVGRDELIVGTVARGAETAINYPFLHTSVTFAAENPKGLVLTNDVAILSHPGCPMRIAADARVVPIMNNPLNFDAGATLEGLDYDLYLVNKTSVPEDATIKVGAGRSLYYRPVGIQNHYEWYGVGSYSINQDIVLDDETARLVMVNSSANVSIAGTVSGTGSLVAWGTGELIFKGETTFSGPIVWETNAKLFFTGSSAGDPNNALTMKPSGSRLHFRPTGYGVQPTTGSIADLTGAHANARVHVYNNQTVTIGTARGTFGFEGDSAQSKVVIEQLEAGTMVTLPSDVELEIPHLGTGVTINLEAKDGIKSWSVKGPTEGDPVNLTLAVSDAQGGTLTLGGRLNVGHLAGFSTVRIVGSDPVGFSVDAGTRVESQNAAVDLNIAEDNGWQNKIALWADATVDASLISVTNGYGVDSLTPAPQTTIDGVTYDQIIAWRDRRSSQTTCEFRNIRFTSAAAWNKGGTSASTVCPFAYTNAIDGKTVVSFNGTSRHLRLMKYNSWSTRYTLNAQYAIVVFGSQLGGGSALFATTNNAFGRSGYNLKPLEKGLEYPMATDSWLGYVDGEAADFSEAKFNGGWQILSLDTRGERICGLGYSTAGEADGSATPTDRGMVQFAEVMLFSEKPTDRERRAAEEYLSAKWGIPLGGQPNDYRLTLAGDGELKLQRDLAVDGRFDGTIDLNGHELTMPSARYPYTEADIPSEKRMLWVDPSVNGAVVRSADEEKPLEVEKVFSRDENGLMTTDGSPALVAVLSADGTVDRRPVTRNNPRTLNTSNAWLDFADWYGDGKGNTLHIRNLPNEIPDTIYVSGSVGKYARTAFVVSDSTSGGGTPIADRVHADQAVKARPSQTTDSWSAPIWTAGSSNYVLQASTWLDGTPVNGTAEGFGGKPEVFSFITDGKALEVKAFGYYGNDSAAHPNREMLGEILLYNRVLDDEEREGIQAYLMGKWLGRLPEGFADFRNLTVTGTGTVKVASAADLPKFADTFTGTVALASTLAFTIRATQQVDGRLSFGGGTVQLPNPCTVDLTVEAGVPVGNYVLLSCAGFDEGQTFELGACRVTGAKRVGIVAAEGVLKAHVTSIGTTVLLR